jgi:hypothetical protein
VIVDVEASRAIRQAEVGAARTMIDRTEDRFGLKPARLAADTAYGSAATLDWIVNDKKIAPHIPVFDKSRRDDGSLSREDFAFDVDRNVYVCSQGKLLHTTGRVHDGTTLLYRARTTDCGPCPLKARCCPKSPVRKIPRSIHESARDVARALAGTEAFEQSRRDRKRVEMLFAHLKRILKLGRLRLRARRTGRVHAGSHRTEPAPARQAGGQAATDSRSMPCLDSPGLSFHRANPLRLMEGG